MKDHLRCPSSPELERAFWERRPDVREHVETCERCHAGWEDISALAAACSDVATQLAPESQRREQIRAALLASPGAEVASPWPDRLRLAVPPVASALAAGLVMWLWPRPTPGPPPPSTLEVAAVETPRRTNILAHGDAQYMRLGSPPDDGVRLVEGELTVDVGVAEGERFRIVTGDGEVDVQRAALDVTAERDRLVAVRVVRGRVEVRSERHQVEVVSEGHVWRPRDVATHPADPVEIAAAEIETPDDSAARAAEREPVPRSRRVARVGRRARSTAPRREAAPEPDPVPDPETDREAEPGDAPDRDAPRRPGFDMLDEGWAQLRDGRFLEAAATLDHAALLAPSPGVAEDARYWTGVALARGGDTDRAIERFTSFLGLYPSSVHAGEASVMLGWLLVERGAFDEAGRRFAAAVDDPSPRVRASAAEGAGVVTGSVRAP